MTDALRKRLKNNLLWGRDILSNESDRMIKKKEVIATDLRGRVRRAYQGEELWEKLIAGALKSDPTAQERSVGVGTAMFPSIKRKDL